jgi:hypothetical protein
MSNLSPTTQAVLDAIKQKWTARDDTFIREFSATVIQSAADNLVFSNQLGLTAYGGFCLSQDQLNVIATELDGFNG